MRTIIILLLFVPSLALAAIGVIGNGASVTCGTSSTVMDDPSIEDKYTRFMLVYRTRFPGHFVTVIKLLEPVQETRV